MYVEWLLPLPDDREEASDPEARLGTLASEREERERVVALPARLGTLAVRAKGGGPKTGPEPKSGRGGPHRRYEGILTDSENGAFLGAYCTSPTRTIDEDGGEGATAVVLPITLRLLCKR